MKTVFECKELMSAIVITLGAVSTVATCQAQTRATSQSSQQIAADSMWRALSTTCPQPGASSSTFFRSGSAGTLIEYRDVRTSVFNWPLAKADELNGIRHKGIAVLHAAAFRDYEPSQGSWSSWQPSREVPRDLSEAAYLKNHMHFEPYWPGMRVVVIEERNGR